MYLYTLDWGMRKKNMIKDIIAFFKLYQYHQQTHPRNSTNFKHKKHEHTYTYTHIPLHTTLHQVPS